MILYSVTMWIIFFGFISGMKSTPLSWALEAKGTAGALPTVPVEKRAWHPLGTRGAQSRVCPTLHRKLGNAGVDESSGRCQITFKSEPLESNRLKGFKAR